MPSAREGPPQPSRPPASGVGGVHSILPRAGRRQPRGGRVAPRAGPSHGLRGQATTEPVVHFCAAAPVHIPAAVDTQDQCQSGSPVPARGHDAQGAGGRLRSSDVHAPPARRQPPLQWPVPGARELRRGVLRSADRPSPLDGAARQHYLPSWRITPCLETGRLRHPPRYATSFPQPVTHSRP